jgi:FkbM family methyltransferase
MQMLKSLKKLGRRIHNRLRRPFFAAHWRNVSYDEQMVEVMARVLKRDSSCIDVGAHTGDVLREMVKLAPRGRHHAFEALPHLAERLRLKFPDVTVHELAVADCSGQAEFLHVENAPAYSGLRERVYDSPDPIITPIRVSVATLDETIPSEQQIAFVKIDVEGGEYHVIKGAA